MVNLHLKNLQDGLVCLPLQPCHAASWAEVQRLQVTLQGWGFGGTKAPSPPLSGSCMAASENSSLRWRGQGVGGVMRPGPLTGAPIQQPPLQLCPWWPENRSRQEKQVPSSCNSPWALRTMMEYLGNRTMFV